jgi:hypothetical protein
VDLDKMSTCFRQRVIGFFLQRRLTLRERAQSGKIPAILLGDFNVGPGYADAIYQSVSGIDGLTEAGASLGLDSALITWDPANPLVKYGGSQRTGRQDRPRLPSKR